MEAVSQLLVAALGGESRAADWRALHDSLKDDIAGLLHRKTHRRPLVIPVMLEI